MFLNVILTLLVWSSTAKIRVAVIDSGAPSNGKFEHCVDPIDLTGGGNEDIQGHATNIAHLIKNTTMAKEAEYCFIFIKFYHKTGYNKQALIGESVKIAVDLKADIINISGGGEGVDALEQAYVLLGLASDIKFVVAAGNDGKNLDENCYYYPACYDPRVIVVGNGRSQNKRSPTSNYGKVVDIWVNGTNKEGGGFIMSGTSQSTAIVTGVLLTKLARKRR